MAKLGTTNNKNDCISDLVDRYTKNDQLKYPFSGLSKLANSIFQVPIVSTTSLISTFLSQSEK